ncbi:MAG: hypothetical protein PHE55_19835 [Methylococcaceae bacterium]|nr:hypothetical protein [Methylococcaceae bacterium]
MNESYEFTKVNAFAEDPATHIVSFNTDTGKKCRIQDEGAGKLDIQFVRRAVVEGSVIFVAYDPDAGLCHFAAPFNEDHVDSIEFIQKPQPSLKVRLVLRPSFLFLLPTHPRFQELRKVLETARAKDQWVWVGTFPGDSEILDVRLPMP